MSHTILNYQCGGLNVIAPHTLIGSSTIRRWSFVRLGMTLLEKCVTVGVGFEVYLRSGYCHCLGQLPVASKM